MNDAHDIEWRCGCGRTNIDYDERCRTCSQERYPEEVSGKKRYIATVAFWVEVEPEDGDIEGMFEIGYLSGEIDHMAARIRNIKIERWQLINWENNAV